MSAEKPNESLPTPDKTPQPEVSEMSAETAIELAKRAFALKKYEQSIEYYGRALEVVTEEVGDDSPRVAALYFSYGQALLENAISQNAVLGKEQQQQDEPEENKASGSKNGPILSFSGDAEEPTEEDPAVDLFAQAAEAVAEAAAAEKEEEEEDDDGEPEDDFNAAWEVFELARAIYEKERSKDSSNEEVALKLADTYIALGDVSLETEKFDQAINDYESALELKKDLLPLSSRQIAEAHYKLCIVLDLTSGRLSDAISHALKAHESITSRLSELGVAQSNASSTTKPNTDAKGKGKGKAASGESVASLTPAQVEAEIKELEGLKEDLAMKIEELKTSPNDSLQESAPALAAKALDKELNATTSASSGPSVVNDLTKVVRKKKNPQAAAESSKRKAEDDGEVSGSEKKPKLDTGN
ncbi:hypothetical protein AAF712_005812 [Marasmius tenuissimus]|uniref:Tetratricopeptide SHNi-TPR domain-containing protein n=1 Tax=Marasmius tenuissimus TaxID=585030 RepID=A0ABR3A3V6_9AGAR